uniref:Uncharacterized protein n=1 Tax=Ciona intestinalis TaxID=7719 RepID=F7AIR9_CIOIN
MNKSAFLLVLVLGLLVLTETTIAATRRRTHISRARKPNPRRRWVLGQQKQSEFEEDVKTLLNHDLEISEE